MTNDESERTDRTLPPYIPFKTFTGFIQKLHETVVPERVDSTLLRSYSGSVGRQLVVALKYLGLVQEGGLTTKRLHDVVEAYDSPEWVRVLNDLILEAYHDLIGNLNLEVATPGQLQERFKAQGAEGGVLAKCVGFFVSAVTAAGVKLSPHIVNKPRAKPGTARPRKAKNVVAATPEPDPLAPLSVSSPGIRFSVPIPDKSPVTMMLPADVSTEDWDMVSTMVKAYIARRTKAGA